MSKYVMLNKDNVVVDIVDVVKPVRKAPNGVTILCPADICEGYLGSSDDTIYSKIGMQFQPSFYDIASIYAVEEVPNMVEPLVYKYTVDDGFFLNDTNYPDTNLGLTKKSKDLEDIVLEMSEIIYA